MEANRGTSDGQAKALRLQGGEENTAKMQMYRKV